MATVRLVGGKVDEQLSAADTPEVEFLGGWLMQQPASCFGAGELIALTRLALTGGAKTVADLAFMRRLRARVELRLEGGFWLDPTNDPAATKHPEADPTHPISGN